MSLARILNLLPWRRRRLERDLERELRFHIDRAVDELTRSGLSEADARRQAALELGGLAQTQEDVRETWIWRWIDHLGRDVRYAMRTLARAPAFAATAILSLAMGIGANAAIFSLADQVLLRTLPVREPERLVHLRWSGTTLTSNWGDGHLVSYPLCRELQEQAGALDGAFCRHPTNTYFSTGGDHRSVRAEIVSGTYFPVLGVRAELGRLIGPADDRQPGAHPVVVLSHDFWRRRFGRDTSVIGARVLLNNYPMTVIGIAPQSFRGVDPLAVPAVWIPAAMTQQAASLDPGWNRLLDRRTAWMHAFARLGPEVTAGEARVRLQPWFQAMLEADTRREGFPSVDAEQRRGFLASTIEVEPAARGVSGARGVLARPLWVLLVGTTLLVLLACLNAAGLVLARGAARNHELTTRLALGASRGRVAAQLTVESALIALAGGALGLLAAPVVSRALLRFLSQDADLAFRIDHRIVLLAFLICTLTAVLCGLAPILRTGRAPLIASLTERAPIEGGARVRKAIVTGQMAFALILLIASGLFVQTLIRLHERADFINRNLVMISIDPPSLGYSEGDAERVMREAFGRLREMPVIERAAIANTSLLSGGWSTNTLTVQSDERIITDRPVSRMRVGPGFFATLGTQVVAGRDFDERDVRAAGSPPTAYRSVIVNESFARRYFRERSPIGHRVGLGNRPNTPTDIEIIGVVRDFPRRTLRDGEIDQVFYNFWDQNSGDGTFYLTLRGRTDSAFAAIRAMMAQVDPALPVSLQTFDDQIDQSLRAERMLATVSSGFGLMALLLSVVGLYGVMSFVVTQRTREIGVRLALGATRPAAVWLILRDALLMIGVGAAIALPAVWALSRLVESQLFGVRPFHGPTIAAATALLALVAIGAAMLPAWRAASVSPTEALRFE